MKLELYFGDHHLGTIVEPFFSDNTGYGSFCPSADQSPETQRVWAFIHLSEDWHRRLNHGLPHDASEFDAFRDVYLSESWHTVDSDGTNADILEPVFADGEVTWRATG